MGDPSEWSLPRVCAIRRRSVRSRQWGGTDSISGRLPANARRAADDARGFFRWRCRRAILSGGIDGMIGRSQSTINVTGGGLRRRRAETAMKSLTGQLLVAMPQMTDPRFARSVVYICAHSEEAGAMGLVVNKLLASLTMDELFTHLKLEPARRNR